MEQISIFDSTLRDGAQGMGISYSIADKLSVITLLDRLGVDYIEAGNPYASPKDMELFQKAAKLPLAHSKLAAFGSTRRKDVAVQEDGNLGALIAAGTQTCVIFGKCWMLHVEEVLETTKEENLRMIQESCAYLCSKGRKVIFDAEHFFDGYQENPDYALDCLEAAQNGGAFLLCLCDTNGGAFPNAVQQTIQAVQQRVSLPLGVHFHNDSGMAVASSVLAVQQGAVQVQGTFLGQGERCGNANLSAVLTNLQLKLGYPCIVQESMTRLTDFAKELAAINNADLPKDLPYVGENAFAHKAGMHAAGVLKNSRSFEHIDPKLVGNSRVLPSSEMSGRAVILERVRQLMPDMPINQAQTDAVLGEMKRLELLGYQFEGADASFQLLVRKQLGLVEDFFSLLYYRIYIGSEQEEELNASATVKVQVGDTVQLMAAEGNGPVNALDTALRKALEVFYPRLSGVKLTDYKVRVLDSHNATAAKVRVLITSWDGRHHFTTVGVSGDVVDASWKAMKAAMEYILVKETQT